MQLDSDHIHYWMQAIRQSDNPIRTLDAFWKGQISSKEWLISNLRPFVLQQASVDIHGGWVGILASMLFQSHTPVGNIRSIDIDPSCAPIATMMNKGEEMQGRFTAVTANMCDIKSNADIIINTSCEHITQADYNRWCSALPYTSVVVLQSNNYNIPEHIRTATSLDNFKEQCNIDTVLWAGELDLPMYTRYMIIGRRK
jgi:hypothetical protein